ncbi:hypothetical protein CYMTET_24765, partial [Cymbomonas tetramitiformis]
RRDWNAVYLALHMMMNWSFVGGFRGFVRTWGPFLVLFPLAVKFFGVAFFKMWIIIISLLIIPVVVYSFAVYSPEVLMYITPVKVDEGHWKKMCPHAHQVSQM